jgi:serine/threonine protein kinase
VQLGGRQVLAPEAGEVLLGKYRVERVVRAGGAGVVLEAHHLMLGERVALKLLLAEHCRSAHAKARFLREAKAVAKLKSERVPRLMDVGLLDDATPYIVMEYLDGLDLRDLARRGPLEIPEVVDLLIQACEGIAVAHARGIIHRDVKPSNLFLTRRPNGDPFVKVIDFGISKMADSDDDPVLTSSTAAFGTALYMSPEQLRQTRSVDLRTDVYALGITGFELLAGRQPFAGDSIPQLCAEILMGTPTPLRELRPEVPDGLACALAKAYERDPDLRYRSMAELAMALASFAPPRSAPVLDALATVASLDRTSTPPERASAPAPPIRPPADPRAASMHMNARRELRQLRSGPTSVALALLEQASALAPHDAAITATLARARVRSWYFSGSDGEQASDAVERALRAGPSLGEAWLAAAMLHMYGERLNEAVVELRRALALEPDLFEAQFLLGRILLEVGAVEEGTALFEAIRAADASMEMMDADLARAFELSGQRARAEQLLEALDADSMVWLTRARIALWRGDVHLAEEYFKRAPRSDLLPITFAKGALVLAVNQGVPVDLLELCEAQSAVPRRYILDLQMAAEISAFFGQDDRVLGALERAVGAGLSDQPWLERCPLLATLRDDPRSAALRATVSTRAARVLEAYRAPLPPAV